MISLTLIVLACLSVWTLVGTTAADKSESSGSNEDFVLGSLEFVLLHEIAHLLIADFDIPVLGPEESAADYLATVALLDIDRADRASDFLISAAQAFELSWDLGTDAQAEIPYWGVHALGIQRFYQIACLMYGRSPSLFGELPTRIGLPESRRQGCPTEYARAVRAVDWMLSEYGRRPTDSVEPRVSIRYEEPSTRASREIVHFVRASGLVERTAARLEERFALPDSVQMVFRPCGHPEAGWAADTRRLTVCYELLDLFASIAGRRGGPVD